MTHLKGDCLVTADARKVSGRDFMDAIGLDSPEERSARQALLRQQCIRAIEAGDTYGWSPLWVEECKAIMADRETLVEVEQLPKRNGRSRIAA